MPLRIAALALLLQPLFGAAWTDRKEYDLVLAIRSESAPQKRLALLDSWTKEYPKTDLRFARLELYLSIYESTGDRAHMFETAGKMVADQPQNPIGNYWYTVLAPESGINTPQALDTASKSADRLLSSLAQQFDDARKPASVSAEDWRKQKTAVEMAVHRTLGWIAWQRNELPAAQQELTTYLTGDPGNAEASLWLGIVTALDKGKQVPALWALARAAVANQPRALADDQRRQVSALVDRVYTSYHGSDQGLEQFRTVSAASPTPPADFSIEAAAVIRARKAEEELRRSNPELAAWITMRQKLDAPDGEGYFIEKLHGQSLPRLKGRIVRLTPARNPQEIALSMTEAGSEDVVLKLSKALPGQADPGTVLFFESSADLFRKDPFTVIVAADPEKVEGWPEQAARKRK